MAKISPVDTECSGRTPHIPQSVVKDGHYEVKIEKIYDPSKFWMIINFRELAIFMQYLKYFYSNVENRNHMPKTDFKNSTCIVRRSDMYYRSVVLPSLLPDTDQIRVFMFDFGYIVNVYIDDIFYMHEKHVHVPRFAIRASLAYISPADQSKTWSQWDLKIFCELLVQKTLFAKVCEIDTKQKVVFTELYVVSGMTSKSVNDLLIDLKVAVNNKVYEAGIELTKYKSTVKYKYLFPSFEALECGAVPSSLWEYDLLKNSVPLDVLYKNYYEFQVLNNSF